jgi:hypothetical protein
MDAPFAVVILQNDLRQHGDDGTIITPSEIIEMATSLQAQGLTVQIQTVVDSDIATALASYRSRSVVSDEFV